MKNKKIVSLIALGLMILPVLKLQAEEGGTSAGASADVKVETEMGGKPDMPPPGPRPGQPMKDTMKVDRPILKDYFQTGDKPSMERRADMKGDADARADMKANGGMQLSAEEKAKMKAAAEARRAEILKKLAAVKGEIKVKLEANAQARVKKLLENVFKRLTNQIERLSNIDARLSTKISALGASGVDVTAITAQHVVAQTALAKAKVDVEATSSLSVDQTVTETSKETLRALVKTAEDSIKAAHDAYKKTIDLLPEVKVEATTNSSTTVGQ